MSKTVEQLMSVKLIPEILDECALCESPDQVVNILKKNQSPALTTILYAVFAPGIVFDVVVPERFNPDPNPKGLSPNSLYMEARRLYVFTTIRSLPPKKKTELLLTILESVHPTEASTLLRVVQRDLCIPQLTYDVVRTAFPGLLPLVD